MGLAVRGRAARGGWRRSPARVAGGVGGRRAWRVVSVVGGRGPRRRAVGAPFTSAPSVGTTHGRRGTGGYHPRSSSSGRRTAAAGEAQVQGTGLPGRPGAPGGAGM